MGRIIGGIIVLLSCIILLAAAAPAKTTKAVYLKDGGIIDCQKVWQANGKVMVLVNRDTLVDFSRDEVDLQKTFAKKHVKGVKKAKAGKKAVSKPGAVMAQAVSRPPAKPGAVAAPAQKTGPAPIAKPAPPTSAQPAPPAVTRSSAVKPLVQGVATSAKKPAPAVAAPLTRTSLPIVKSPVSPVKEPLVLSREMGASYIIYLLLLTILMVVAFCKVFAKAGEAWWKAIIPIYSMFVLVIISGKPWWWGLLMLIPIVNIPIYFIIHIALARRFGQGVVFGLGLALVGIVFYPLLAFGKYEYS